MILMTLHDSTMTGPFHEMAVTLDIDREPTELELKQLSKELIESRMNAYDYSTDDDWCEDDNAFKVVRVKGKRQIINTLRPEEPAA